jgi:hypothetical protein
MNVGRQPLADDVDTIPPSSYRTTLAPTPVSLIALSQRHPLPADRSDKPLYTTVDTLVYTLNNHAFCI